MVIKRNILPTIAGIIQTIVCAMTVDFVMLLGKNEYRLTPVITIMSIGILVTLVAFYFSVKSINNRVVFKAYLINVISYTVSILLYMLFVSKGMVQYYRDINNADGIIILFVAGGMASIVFVAKIIVVATICFANTLNKR